MLVLLFSNWIYNQSMEDKAKVCLRPFGNVAAGKNDSHVLPPNNPCFKHINQFSCCYSWLLKKYLFIWLHLVLVGECSIFDL